MNTRQHQFDTLETRICMSTYTVTNGLESDVGSFRQAILSANAHPGLDTINFNVPIPGLKDSSGDFKQFQAFRAAAPELAITVGNEADITRAIAAGGAGTICGMANVVPELVKGMVEGKDVEARMQAAIEIVLKTPSFTATLKAILAAQTGDAAWQRVRPPLRASSDGSAFKRKLDELTAPAIA